MSGGVKVVGPYKSDKQPFIINYIKIVAKVDTYFHDN